MNKPQREAPNEKKLLEKMKMQMNNLNTRFNMLTRRIEDVETDNERLQKVLTNVSERSLKLMENLPSPEMGFRNPQTITINAPNLTLAELMRLDPCHASSGLERSPKSENFAEVKDCTTNKPQQEK
jgi:hypothetical protein